MEHRGNQKDLSLKGLELFQICAQKGSLKATAAETGLSVSTISHHLKNLEYHLGVPLFDHARRPLMLTPNGQAFLHNIDDALRTIRRAKAEASAGHAGDVSFLRLGTIEDLDSDIVPELAVYLSASLPQCSFTYITDASRTIIDLLHDRKLDLGITASPPERLPELNGRPLLQDPFVVVLPRSADMSAEDAVGGRSQLQFLRFSGNLLIARQIESQLRRTRISMPARFECSNNQTLMAMVAAGAGWTITTPLLFARAKRFQPKLRMLPFPGKSFGRRLDILSTFDCSETVLDLVDQRIRGLVNEFAITPLIQMAPWLKERFVLIDR